MSGVQVIGQIDAGALHKLAGQHEASWVNQSISPEASQRFQVLLNGAPGQATATDKLPTVVTDSKAVNGKSDVWDDVFHREELMRALAAMSNVQPYEMPAAAAKVTIISLDMQMKVDSVRQASKNTEDSVQSMLRA